MRIKQRAKKRKGPQVVEKPKKPLSAYMLFYQVRCKQVKIDGRDKKKQNEMQQECSRMWNEMNEVDKQPFEEQVKEASKVYQDWMSTQKKKSRIDTRISLPVIVNTVSKFTRQQLEAMKAIGFGSLIHLRCTRVNHRFCEWLVNNFDPAECALTAHGRKLMVTPLDVEHIMGVSAKGSEVIIEGLSSNAITEMSVKYGFKSGLLSLKDLREDLQSTEEHGDEFKVKVALLALGGFLCPSMKPGINQNLLHALLDVSSLSKKNWAKLVLDFLVRGIHNYKENKQVGVSGCVLFLMLFYLENFIPVGLPSSFTKTASYPLIGMWGNQEVNARVRFLQNKGLFTNKKILLVTPNEQPPKDTPPIVTEPLKETPRKDGLHTWMDKVDIELVQMKRDIRSLLENFNSVKEELGDTIRVVNNLVACRHQQQREREKSPSFRESPKNEEYERNQSRSFPNERIYSPVPPVATKSKYSTPRGSFNNSAKVAAKNYKIDPDSLRPSEKVTKASTPVDELSSIPLAAKKRKHPPPKGLENTSQVRRSPRKKATRKMEGEHEVTSKPPPRTRVQDKRLPSRYTRSPYTAGTSKPRKRGVPVAVFEGQVKKKVEELLSNPPTIERVQQLVPDPPTIELTLPAITQEERNIVDYVLDQSQPLKDIIVRYELEQGDRETLLWLREGEWVTDLIINLAVVRLTYEERCRHDNGKCRRWYLPTYFSTQITARTPPSCSEMSRNYFGTGRYTSAFRSVERIFIPMNDNNAHWFLCVIDLPLQKIFILDSLPDKQKLRARDKLVVRIVSFVDMMLIQYYGNEYSSSISLFEHHRVGWIPKQKNGYDCGVYVIMYMQLLDLNPGTKFTFGSEEARQRILVDLVTSEYNTIKEEVLQKVASYTSQQQG